MEKKNSNDRSAKPANKSSVKSKAKTLSSKHKTKEGQKPLKKQQRKSTQANNNTSSTLNCKNSKTSNKKIDSKQNSSKQNSASNSNTKSSNNMPKKEVAYKIKEINSPQDNLLYSTQPIASERSPAKKQINEFIIVHRGKIILDILTSKSEDSPLEVINSKKTQNSIFASSIYMVGPNCKEISIPQFLISC